MRPDGGALRRQVEPVAMTRSADLSILDSQASDTKTLVGAVVDAGCCQPPPPSSLAPRQIAKKKYRRRSIASRARASTPEATNGEHFSWQKQRGQQFAAGRGAGPSSTLSQQPNT